MVKVTKDIAQKHRADLLQTAGQVMRAEGISAATVAAIAGRVGLTHGAIYRQFPSKAGLAAAAITEDFDRIVALLDRLAATGGSLADYFRAYLATDHRDHFIWGCPIAPLAAEVSRVEPEVQSAFRAGMERNLVAIARLADTADADAARAYATATLATLSGAMAIARSLRDADPVASREVLDVTLAALLSDPRCKRKAPS